MALVPGSTINSTHKWACAQYCPQDGDFISSVLIGDGKKGIFDTPKDLGKATISQPAIVGGATKECEKWQWTETILKVLPLQETDFYVDMSTTPPQPFFSSSDIKPLGEEIGQENTSFIGFVPLTAADDYFDIDMDSITTCAKSDNCGDDPPPSAPSASGRHLKGIRFLKSIHQVAEERVNALPAEKRELLVEKADPPPPEPNISFGTSFTATENNILEINQGGKKIPSGDICCDGGASQCQLQLQHSAGTRYFDLDSKRTRFEDTIAKQVQVDYYKVHMSLLVNVTNGVETCQEFCPIDPRDTLDPFDPFDPFDKVTDMGPTTLDGKAVEHYQWSDVILKIIKMQTTDFYADLSGPTAVPVAAYTKLTPFGEQQIGGQNQTWSNWVPGVPPVEKFTIAGLKVCPRSQNCGSSQMQAHRLRTRQLHTFSRYAMASFDSYSK